MFSLDKKSTTNQHFYISEDKDTLSSYDSCVIINYQPEGHIVYTSNDMKDSCTLRKRVTRFILPTLGLSYNKIYSLRNFITTNLTAKGIPLNVTIAIRNLLSENDLINEYDREYLNSIGFNENEEGIRVLDNADNKRLHNVLFRNDITYLWQLLLLDEKSLSKLQRCGTTTLDAIKGVIESYGYQVRNYRVAEQYKNSEVPEDLIERELAENNQVKENIYQIIQTREAYVKKARKYLDLVEEYDNKLKEALNGYQLVKKRNQE